MTTYRGLRGAGVAVDVVVATAEEIQRYRDDPYLIVASALREGKVVYGYRCSGWRPTGESVPHLTRSVLVDQ